MNQQRDYNYGTGRDTQSHTFDTGELEMPDFNSADNVSLQQGELAHQRRSRLIVIAVLAGSVALISVIALIASFTVFNPKHAEPLATAQPLPSRSLAPEDQQPQKEVVPPPTNPAQDPPSFVFKKEASVTCPEVSAPESATPASPGYLRSGHLEFQIPRKFDQNFFRQSVGYTANVQTKAKRVESYWYSTLNVGQVIWDKPDFPPLEEMASAIFQCYATSGGMYSVLKDDSTVTDYLSREITVDGHEAWQMQATYHFSDPQLKTTSASILLVIVVKTGSGYSAFFSDVAEDHQDHVDALTQAVNSLRVV